MAEKIACGYFLLLRNKKRLISMAVAREWARMAEKIACGYFLLLSVSAGDPSPPLKRVQEAGARLPPRKRKELPP